ncbi:SOS response-associated peptidase [Georgenia halophila]|uniref:Abasic site processing protein n=1 Tax=Georgenia halophila TaxID=620889 RepID=A0ABP8LLF8_9MICO
MCGRYANARRDADLIDAFDVDDVVGEELPPSWNIAPTQDVRTVLERTPRGAPEAPPARQLRTVRWGLVPSWSKDPSSGARLINARSESVTEKPSFKKAASRRRCVVAADGYFEWEKLPDGGKQPYFLHGDGLLAFAGLYELWPDPELPDDHPDKWLWTMTIMTTTATDTLGEIHDRCPVVVPADMVPDWLDPSVTHLGDVRSMIDAMPSPQLDPRPVGRAVGNVNNDGPELVKPVE